MKKTLTLLFIVLIGFVFVTGQVLKMSNDDPTSVVKVDPNSKFTYETKNIPVNTKTEIINSPSGIMAVGPNYIPYPTTATQSEIHSYANPSLPGRIMIGWNSYGPSFYGTGFAYTTNTGANWTGSNTLPGLSANSGDPSVAITSNGTIFMNAIGSSYSTQVISWSTNGGANWAPYVIAGQNSSGSTADKNHMGIDDKVGSPYYNNLYIAWTDFSVTNYPAKMVRSTNLGVNWSTPLQVTTPGSGYFSQGVNVHTGPNGEVYMVNATNQSGSPYTEKFMGFSKSTDGGVTFSSNSQAFAINGIRGNLKSSSIRVNSFPWMAVDKTGGPRNGWLYVTWAQRSLAPAGSDPDILFASSSNGGTNWSTPVRVNDDPMNNGRDQWFSNINVDSYGGINIIFYDSRNPTTNDSAEVYVGRSIDGGLTFENIKVSDHRFRPVPISGLAGGYQGDYIGITSTNNKIFPTWCDNSTGTYQTWTATIDLGPSINHIPLTNTEQIVGTRQVLAQITPAGSGINPSQTKLFFTKNPSLFTDSVVMTHGTGNNWTANLTLSGAGTYRYYIKTIDSINRVATAPGGAPSVFYSFIASSDTVRPVITHTPLANVPKVSWPVAVYATVTDNIGVDSVWVRWYKNNTGTGIKHFKLLPTGGDNYSAVFNSVNADVAVGDSIFYRIFAKDISAAHNVDSTVLNQFKIINLVTVCLGTGSVAMGSSSGPYNTYWWGNRTNILWTAAELTAAGATAGYINQIGFQVSVASSQAMNGLTFRFQNTTATTLSGFVSTGWTQAYTGTYTVPGTGWQYVTMTTPFQWNGTSNLLCEVCFGNTSYTTATTVLGTSMSGMEYTEYHDLSTACAYTGFTAGTSQTARANTCFVISPLMGVTPGNGSMPTVYELQQNYPNPFNPTTKINFAIPKQGLVTLKVYDVLGREVANLVNEVKTAGNYIVDFDASYLASGVYFYKLEVNGFNDVKRMMLIK